MKKIYMSGPLIEDDDEKIVLDAVRNGWYGENAYKYVELLEKSFAKYHNRKYALMTTNCTSAIHLALMAFNVKTNDEVIVPDCTWIGSSAPINYTGATTIFADVDAENWCLNEETINKVITKKTKAVICVNLYGNMPDYNKIEKICNENGIFLIEDAAESLGSKVNNKKSGSFGDVSVFSFHRTKTMTTGEGGMLITNNKKIYEKCKILRDHGRKSGEYFNTELAYKYMPFNLQAALGYSQFKKIDRLVSKKRYIWKKYMELMFDIEDIYFNPEPPNTYNSVWCTTLIFGKSHKITKNKAIEKLNSLGLPSRPFFYPLSTLPAYKKLYKIKVNNETAYDISSRGINLPCALNLDEETINKYSIAIKSILSK